MTDRPILPPEFQPLTGPLGELAIAWNLMEAEVNLMLISLTDTYNTETAETVFPNLDFRDKIKSVRNLGFLDSPNDKWFARLEIELNKLDNEDRPARNRFTHDHLIVEDGILYWETIELKLVRPQARQRSLLYRRLKSVNPLRVRALAQLLLRRKDSLKKLRAEFELAMPRTKREIPRIDQPEPETPHPSG